VVLGDLLCTGHVILRMRSKLCSLQNGKTLFFAYNMTIFVVPPWKWQRQIGVRNFKNVDYFCPG